MITELGTVGVVTTNDLDDKLSAITHDPMMIACIKAVIREEKDKDRMDAVQVLKDNGMEIAAMLIRRT